MFDILSGKTRLYPIIGDPIKHVESPERLTRSFSECGHNGICIPMQIQEGYLESVMQLFTSISNIDGLLVTMPHKFNAYKYCATSSERSKLLKTVSVVRRNPDGSWHGDMLDGLSFVKAQKNQGAHPEGARVLLVGAGGTGRAIAIALIKTGVRELIIYDKNEDRVKELIELVEDLDHCRVIFGPPDPTGCDMVFNATPMGMEKGDPLPVDEELLAPSMFVGDVISGRGETPLLSAAKVAGCKTANGNQMVEAVQEMMIDFMLSDISDGA